MIFGTLPLFGAKTPPPRGFQINTAAAFAACTARMPSRGANYIYGNSPFSGVRRVLAAISSQAALPALFNDHTQPDFDERECLT